MKLFKKLMILGMLIPFMSACGPKTYTITWTVEGNIVETDTVNEGVVPTYGGDIPTKQGDAQYTYTFSGWAPEVVEAKENTNYTAQFTSTVNNYTVKFVDGETTLQTLTVAYGTTPEYTGEPLTIKMPTEEESTVVAFYVFDGWDKEIVPVTCDATYSAVWTPVTLFEICYTDCANAVAMTFGEEYVDQLVKTTNWETKGLIYFSVNVGQSLGTITNAASYLNALATSGLSYTAIYPMALDETSGYYVGTYLNEVTGAVCYPLAASSGTNVIIQMQFTHVNLLG